MKFFGCFLNHIAGLQQAVKKLIVLSFVFV